MRIKKLLTISSREKPREREHLCRIDEELLTFLEGLGLHLVRELDGDEEVAKGPEDLVDFADLIGNKNKINVFK